MDVRTRRLIVASTLALGATAAGSLVLYLMRMSHRDGAEGALRRPTIDLDHRWRSVRGRHWQIISTAYEDPAETDAREGTRGDCPTGMVQVKGEMVVEPDDNPYSEGRIETMQLQHCTDWIQKEYPERCQQFDGDAWEDTIAELETTAMDPRRAPRWGSAAWVTYSAPKKLMSMIRRKTAASVSSKKLRWVRPALLMRMSMPP